MEASISGSSITPNVLASLSGIGQIPQGPGTRAAQRRAMAKERLENPLEGVAFTSRKVNLCERDAGNILLNHLLPVQSALGLLAARGPKINPGAFAAVMQQVDTTMAELELQIEEEALKVAATVSQQNVTGTMRYVESVAQPVNIYGRRDAKLIELLEKFDAVLVDYARLIFFELATEAEKVAFTDNVRDKLSVLVKLLAGAAARIRSGEDDAPEPADNNGSL